MRNKLPDEGASRLIQRAVPTAALVAAPAPRGDMAFAVAVAAYGQRLRGDAMLNGYGWRQIVALAGQQSQPWRREFVELVALAGSIEQG